MLGLGWCVLPLSTYFNLRYDKLSPLSLCEIDCQLRPDSPASSSWLLRGPRARRRHDSIASWRMCRRQDKADWFSDSGRACGKSPEFVDIHELHDVSYSSMDLS